MAKRALPELWIVRMARGHARLWFAIALGCVVYLVLPGSLAHRDPRAGRLGHAWCSTWSLTPAMMAQLAGRRDPQALRRCRTKARSR